MRIWGTLEPRHTILCPLYPDGFASALCVSVFSYNISVHPSSCALPCFSLYHSLPASTPTVYCSVTQPLPERHCYSVTQPCPTLCDPMDCSTAGPSVPHHLPKFAQVHVHPSILSSDALFSFCPQPFPAPQTFPLSQLFASYDQNTRVSASLSVLQTSIQG